MSVRLEDLPPWAREQAERQLRGEPRRPSAAAPGNGYQPTTAGTSPPPNKGSSVQPAPDKVIIHKYHNQPDVRADIRFGSKKEARRYDELMLLLRAGEIRDLRLQPQFTLQEAYTTPEGVHIWAIRYYADFSYERATTPDVTGEVHWIKVVEDVKSRPTRTKVYAIKRKMMRERLGIDVQEVM